MPSVEVQFTVRYESVVEEPVEVLEKWHEVINQTIIDHGGNPNDVTGQVDFSYRKRPWETWKIWRTLFGKEVTTGQLNRPR